MTAKEFANIYNISLPKLYALLQAGVIRGAIRHSGKSFENAWIIPDDAELPEEFIDSVDSHTTRDGGEVRNHTGYPPIRNNNSDVANALVSIAQAMKALNNKIDSIASVKATQGAGGVDNLSIALINGIVAPLVRKEIERDPIQDFIDAIDFVKNMKEDNGVKSPDLVNTAVNGLFGLAGNLIGGLNADNKKNNNNEESITGRAVFPDGYIPYPKNAERNGSPEETEFEKDDPEVQG